MREQIVPQERRLAIRAGPLLVPPDAVIMRGATDDVGSAVAVHVVGIHIRGRVTEVGGVKAPRFGIVSGGLLPPAAGADNIEPTVAVDVADAQAVRIAERA